MQPRSNREMFGHIHEHLKSIEGKLDALLGGQDAILGQATENQEIIMSALSDALDQAEAAANDDAAADSSAQALLISLSQMVADLKTNSTDPATVTRITALSDGIKARAAALAAAVVANTPAAPPAP